MRNLILAIALIACAPGKAPCDPSRFADDTDTPMEVSRGTACERAAKNLRKVCPTHVTQIEDLAKTTYEKWCQYEVDHNTPICPSKLAKVNTCEEAEHVCR